jgi:peptidyl-prolyl cis-trans isomerase SurA
MMSADRSTLLALVLALATLAGACRSKPAAPTSAAPVSQDVWAVVDGREIRREDVEKAYRRAVQPNQPVSEDEATTVKLNLLDQLITQDIMLAKANELKIVLPETELDNEVNERKKSISEEDMNKELAARNLTAADMREALRRDLLTEKLMAQEVTSKINVTDQDITDFFQANKAQFNLPEEAFHLGQIIVTPVRDPGLNNRTGDDAATPQAAVTKVQMVMERLKGGTPFSELALDYSEEPESTPRGGDVGLVPLSALRKSPPKLRDAVLKAQPGSATVVSMDGGHTIVWLVKKLPAGQRDPSMPEVRSDITAALKNRREELLRRAYLDTMQREATVVNHLARRVVESQGKPVAAK